MSAVLPNIANVGQNGEIVIMVNGYDIRECCTEDSISNNENIQNVAFLIDSGYGSSWVAGMQKKINMTGKYVKGNAFCEWLNSVEDEIGAARVTTCSLTRFGHTISGSVTLENIVIGGGGAIDGAPISFTIAFNGKPTGASGASGGGE